LSKTLGIILFLSLESVVFFLYICRETSTNQRKNAKQTQFLWIFCLETMISQKNKPNSNPIQSQYSAIIEGANPIQTQTKFIPEFIPECYSLGSQQGNGCLLASLSGTQFQKRCVLDMNIMKEKFLKIYLTKMFDSFSEFCKIALFV
jgi:hypothetical protein